MIGTTIGGLGLFLLGMILLTDALKGLAGDSLRAFLARFTGGSVSSMATGALTTALVQSSSATTLMTIGFVSAGLLTFEQAIGVILGANIGTTSTGWIVAFLGLKLSVSKVALPLIGVGALARLMTRGRLAAAGMALAGFGLVFVGIDTMQTGMESLSKSIKPEDLALGGFAGRAALVLVGAVMTVVMQSSSAAVAATLTALHAETIGLEEAAALVIGQNVGTTVTAGFASVGASVPGKRTALAHVFFNLSTGFVVFLALPLILPGLVAGCRALALEGPALQLAAFHTIFNLVGVLLFAPLIGPFASTLRRLVPDRGPRLTRHLGPLTARAGSVALEAARRTLIETGLEAVKALRLLLSGDEIDSAEESLAAAEAACEETRGFLALVGEEDSGKGDAGLGLHVRLFHALDHLERFIASGREKNRAAELSSNPDVARVLEDLSRAMDAVVADPESPQLPGYLRERSEHIASLRRERRPRLLVDAAQRKITPRLVSDILEVIRWVDRATYHLARAQHHLIGSSELSSDSKDGDREAE